MTSIACKPGPGNPVDGRLRAPPVMSFARYGTMPKPFSDSVFTSRLHEAAKPASRG